MTEYTDNERALIWLSLPQGVSPFKKIEWLNNFDSPSEMYEKFVTDKDFIIDVIGANSYVKLEECYNAETLDGIIQEHESRGVALVTMDSENYPDSLKDIEDSPLCLYCKGNVSLMDSGLMIAVVGTRRATRYGKDVTKKLVSEMAHTKFVIVSGLAKGIDAIAHTVTLDNGSATIAVLGCGLDTMYPSENLELARRIIDENSLIISEYPFGVKPYPYNFPQRNRIISGLAKCVLITEAGLKSGTMITADTALSQGKDVLAVPGNIFSEESLGANQLILNGATMITGINDIYKFFNLKDREGAPTNIQLDFIEQSIVDELVEDRHFDDLLIKSGLTVEALMPILLNLELCGIIRKLPGNYYGRTIV